MDVARRLLKQKWLLTGGFHLPRLIVRVDFCRLSFILVVTLFERRISNRLINNDLLSQSHCEFEFEIEINYFSIKIYSIHARWIFIKISELSNQKIGEEICKFLQLVSLSISPPSLSLYSWNKGRSNGDDKDVIGRSFSGKISTIMDIDFLPFLPFLLERVRVRPAYVNTHVLYIKR